jgi:hypothetical protein
MKNSPSGNVLPYMNYQFVGVLAFLLAGMEQDALQEQITTRMNVRQLDANWWNNPSTWRAAHARVPTFLCPSDNAWERKDWVSSHVRQHIVPPGVMMYSGYYLHPALGAI